MAHSGFSEEERRIRKRILELGINQKKVAEVIGLQIRDVSEVVRGRSRTPHYIAEVYKFLGLEMPEIERRGIKMTDMLTQNEIDELVYKLLDYTFTECIKIAEKSVDSEYEQIATLLLPSCNVPLYARKSDSLRYDKEIQKFLDKKERKSGIRAIPKFTRCVMVNMTNCFASMLNNRIKDVDTEKDENISTLVDFTGIPGSAVCQWLIGKGLPCVDCFNKTLGFLRHHNTTGDSIQYIENLYRALEANLENYPLECGCR